MKGILKMKRSIKKIEIEVIKRRVVKLMIDNDFEKDEIKSIVNLIYKGE